MSATRRSRHFGQPNGVQGGALTPTAHKGKDELVEMDFSALHVIFLNRERVGSKRRVCASTERQEAIEQAPKRA